MLSITSMILRAVHSSQAGLSIIIFSIYILCIDLLGSSESKNNEGIMHFATISYCGFAGLTVEQLPLFSQICQNNLLLRQTWT